MSKIKIFRLPLIVSHFFPKRIWSFDTKKEVYITFDDGPHSEITPWLLDYAKQNNIHFNFFWLGKNIEAHPQLLTRAIKEEHIVANHGYEHLNAAKVNPTLYIENFKKGKDLVPVNFFRPPYGRLPKSLAKEINKSSIIIMWSWLSYDWKKDVSNESILKKLNKDIKAGQILVFHESEKTKNRIKDLIPAVIEIIAKKNLKCAKLPLN